MHGINKIFIACMHGRYIGFLNILQTITSDILTRKMQYIEDGSKNVKVEKGWLVHGSLRIVYSGLGRSVNMA